MKPVAPQGPKQRTTLRLLAVTNLYPSSDAPTSGTFIEQQIKGLRQNGLSVDLMFLDRIGQGRSAYVGLDRKIKAAVVSFEPDVIHVMYGGILADKITKAVRDRPVIVSFCGTDLLGEPLVGWLQKLSAGYNVWASRHAAKQADGIVVKSKNLLHALPDYIDRTKVRIIPNGVDIERFKPMNKIEARKILGWGQESAVVLFVTVRGHPRKRLGLAEEAVKSIGPCGRKIEFRIMQGVPHDKVPLWLNASDALILTSVHEGGVNVVKEAMACNLPIVSVDVGDVRERLNGVRMCAIVESDPARLGRALTECLLQGGRSNGREHLGDVTLVAVSERLKSFYLEILEKSLRKTRDHCAASLTRNNASPIH
jgi:glycosyltransferase involved in cell wall biosynthesis